MKHNMWIKLSDEDKQKLEDGWLICNSCKEVVPRSPCFDCLTTEEKSDKEKKKEYVHDALLFGFEV